jgi:hypothetical protein
VNLGIRFLIWPLQGDFDRLAQALINFGQELVWKMTEFTTAEDAIWFNDIQ